MPAPEESTAEPKPEVESRETARAQRELVDKFVRNVGERSIVLSQQNRRSRVCRIDVYQALWQALNKRMPASRVKKHSARKTAAASVYVKTLRRQRDLKANMLAMAATANAGAGEQISEDQDMETESISHSETVRSSNTVEMQSVESAGPSTSGTGRVPCVADELGADTSDESSADSSAPKTGSGESAEHMEEDNSSGKNQKSSDNTSMIELTTTELPAEGDLSKDSDNDAEQLPGEISYTVEEPKSDESEAESKGDTNEVVEVCEEDSSKHSLGGAESLPEDDADKQDSDNSWKMELAKDSEEDSEERPPRASEESSAGGSVAVAVDDVVARLAGADLQTSRKRNLDRDPREPHDDNSENVTSMGSHDEDDLIEDDVDLEVEDAESGTPKKPDPAGEGAPQGSQGTPSILISPPEDEVTDL